MAKRKDRINYITNTLSLRGLVNIKELSEKLEVSEMTIRRDLELLAKENIAQLIHGGAILKKNISTENEKDSYLITNAESRMIREKMKICQQAASLIEPNDIIIIDSGTTTEYLPKFIQPNMPLTIICFALNILFGLYENKNFKIIMTGGYFHDNTLMFESPEGVEFIKKVRANKAFITAAGVDDKLGVTCATTYEVETKKAAIESSDTKILLADSTKFGKIRISYFADLKNFDIIITDTGIAEEYQKYIKDLGIKLYLV
jgi:DeoR family deoxyribose operon repressor